MSDKQTDPETSNSETWIAIAFWMLILGVAWIWYHHRDQADVLLDVATQPELVKGTVSFNGVPVRGGFVRIEVAEQGNNLYRGGATLVVGENGMFTSQGQPKLGLENAVSKLRVGAAFYGSYGEKDKTKPLGGESTIYINSAAPLDQGFLNALGLTVGALLVIQLFLFTGDLGPRKARWLFVLMYFFTFFSLALPISLSLIVAQNPYLVDAMEASPIGLVKAKTKALTEPQWLINIGGKVVSGRLASINKDIPPDKKTDAQASKAELPTVPEGSGKTVASQNANADQDATIEGGIAVPFFVVLLAMFGAGINMTLKVPEIQRSYEDVLSESNTVSPWFNPLAATWRLIRHRENNPVPAAPLAKKTAGDIRRDLIENYMYLISAPLLAVAMYYLLQILAQQVTQPVLVVMALATGLVSKAVIGGIIGFAEKNLRNDDPVARATEARARQADAEAARLDLEAAKAQQAAAEAVAVEADEIARKAQGVEALVLAAVGTGEATEAQAKTAQEVSAAAAKNADEMQTAAKATAKEVERAAQNAESKRIAAETAASDAKEAEVKQTAATVDAQPTPAPPPQGATQQAETANKGPTVEEPASVGTIAKPPAQ